MPALLEQGVDLDQLGPHPFRHGLALDPETAALRLPADVGEAEEVERLGLADTPRRSRPGGVPSELDQPRFVGMQLQTEFREPLAKIGEELLRISLILETGDKESRPGESHPRPLAEPAVHVSAQRAPITQARYVG